MPRSPSPLMGSQQNVILARVGAFIVDEICSILVAVVAGLGVGVPFESRPLVFLTILFVFVGYYVLLEGLFGQTPGKKLFGVVVVKRDGSPCTLGAAFVRNLLRIVDGLFHYAVGLVVMMLNDERQRIGDLVAETVVVRVK